MKNQIEKWINSDKQLYNLIIEIQSMDKSEIEQAEIAFHRLSELYNLPIMPEELQSKLNFIDKTDDENTDFFEPRSVFEEYALLKFLNPSDDPRGIVLLAIYNVKNNVGVDYNEVAKKEFGNQIPKNLQIGIKGDKFHSEVIFPQKEGKSWFDLGCKINIKLI